MIQFYPCTNIDMSYDCIFTMKNILGLGVLLELKQFDIIVRVGLPGKNITSN